MSRPVTPAEDLVGPPWGNFRFVCEIPRRNGYRRVRLKCLCGNDVDTYLANVGKNCARRAKMCRSCSDVMQRGHRRSIATYKVGRGNRSK